MLRLAILLTILIRCVEMTVNPVAVNKYSLPDSFEGSYELINKIMLMSPLAQCSFIVVTDEGLQPTNMVHQAMQQTTWGLTVFELNILKGNKTSIDADILDIVEKASKTRRLSWNTVVLLMSTNIEFLSSAGNYFSKARLLVWTTRLMVVTSIPLKDINYLLEKQWTFTMMNTILLNSEKKEGNNRWSIYANIPYSKEPSHVRKIAFWNRRSNIYLLEDSELFQEKFVSFHGSRVNITALPFAPYWVIRKQQKADGSTYETVKGTDKILLDTIAEVLNFTVHQIPAKTWKEVTQMVTDRVSFLATVFHVMLPQRMDRYDYSYPYEFSLLSFSAAKPAIIPQWQALYYPLADMVWVALLITILLILVFFNIINSGAPLSYQEKMETASVAEVVLCSLFSQSLSVKFPSMNSFLVVLGFWLMFVFIVSTAYRGNLTASLTLPKHPPRAETIEELVRSSYIATMSAYATEHRNFFRQSNSPVFRTLGQNMILGPTVQDGLRRALTSKEAFMAGRRYLEQHIAQYFTKADGSTQLYIGRESAIPGMAAWPIPHDAPFKPQVDKLMMSVIEGGLYEKWSRDTLHESRLESMRELKKGDGKVQEAAILTEESEKEDKSLTTLNLIHMQGPFMILIFGLIFSSMIIFAEIFI